MWKKCHDGSPTVQGRYLMSGKATLTKGKLWSSTTCQWKTLNLFMAMRSRVSWILAGGRKWREVSSIRPLASNTAAYSRPEVRTQQRNEDQQTNYDKVLMINTCIRNYISEDSPDSASDSCMVWSTHWPLPKLFLNTCN